MSGLLVGIGIAVVIWSAAVLVLIALGRGSQARELVMLIPNLLLLFRGLLRDPRMPRGAKVWLWVRYRSGPGMRTPPPRGIWRDLAGPVFLTRSPRRAE